MDSQEVMEQPRGSVVGVVMLPIRWLSRLLAMIATACVDWVARKIHSTAIGSHLSIDLLRYAICGVGNYIVFDAVLYFLTYNYVVGSDTYINIGIATISPHVFSLIIVFPITFFTGFWLNRHVAFASTHVAVGRQLTRYAISIIGSIILSYLILKGLVETLGVWPTPAKVIGSLTTATYSYLMARLYTFPKRSEKEAGSKS